MKKSTTTPAAKTKHRYYKAVYYRTDGTTRTITFQEPPEAPVHKPHKRAAKPVAQKSNSKRRTVKRA